MRVWLASTIALLLALSPAVGEAAPAAGVVTGVVKDALERPLPMARVRLETTDGRVAARATADDQGRFTFGQGAPGTYAVIAEHPGFEPATAIVTLTEAEGQCAWVLWAMQGTTVDHLYASYTVAQDCVRELDAR